MHKAALNLFLAECTATALREEIELKGSLASALQIRHKIRDTDLKRLFELADEAPPDTFRRCYYVYTLQLYAGSAYSTLEPIMSAAAHTLANVQVSPHWDPLKTHNFGSIYAAEPMNLFPGWSLTNARNNQFMLDAHRLMKHSDGGFSTDLHGETPSSSTTRTVGMQISGALRQEDERMTEKRLDGGKLSGLKPLYSPYSKSLKESEPFMSEKMKKLHGEERRKYDKSQALGKFEKISLEMKRTTVAGTDHYRLLFESLALQQVNNQTLLDAQTYWSRHRIAVQKEIDVLINDLRLEDAQDHAMTLRHYKSR
jgi:hypothetical protein